MSSAAEIKYTLRDQLVMTLVSFIEQKAKQEAQMGLKSLTWVFCHNSVKTYLVFLEILSFSCSVLLLVKADGDHLAVPNCKKIKMA